MTISPWPILAELLLFTLLSQVAYLASTLVAAPLLGARAEVARIGFGPRLWAPTWRGTRFELCAIPLVASVTLEGMIEAEGPPQGFRALHPLRRAAVVTGAWVLPALLAALAIGPGPAAHHVATALPHMARMLVAEDGVGLVRTFLALPFRAGLGVFLAVTVGLNLLLPVPSLSGGLLLRYLLAWIAPATDRDRGWFWLHAIGIVALLVGCGREIYVIFRAIAG